MSKTYDDLVYTSFPDNIDTYEYLSDVSASQLELINQYNTYLSSNNLEAANKLLVDNPGLVKCMINATSINKLIDSIKSIQRLYKADIQNYIYNRIHYCGKYNSSIIYNKFDAVYKILNGKTLFYLCSVDGTKNVDVTVTDNWITMTQQGERGEPGFGLTYSNSYDSSKSYQNNSMVTYNNALWATTNDNVTDEPNIESDNWSKIMDFNIDDLSFCDETTNIKYKIVIDNGSLYLEEI